MDANRNRPEVLRSRGHPPDAFLSSRSLPLVVGEPLQRIDVGAPRGAKRAEPVTQRQRAVVAFLRNRTAVEVGELRSLLAE